jgi:hypothetical protein
MCLKTNKQLIDNANIENIPSQKIISTSWDLIIEIKLPKVITVTPTRIKNNFVKKEMDSFLASNFDI